MSFSNIQSFFPHPVHLGFLKCMLSHLLILSFELAKAIRDNLDDETIKCFILLKKLIEPIRNLEYENIIEFAKVWASTEVYHEINDKILQKYVKREFENAEKQEVCRIKFGDSI